MVNGLYVLLAGHTVSASSDQEVARFAITPGRSLGEDDRGFLQLTNDGKVILAGWGSHRPHGNRSVVPDTTPDELAES